MIIAVNFSKAITAVQIWIISFPLHITSLLTGKYELHKLTSLPKCGFIAQLVKHRTGIRGGHGFEFVDCFRLFLLSCLNWRIYCDDHSSLSVTECVRDLMLVGTWRLSYQYSLRFKDQRTFGCVLSWRYSSSAFHVSYPSSLVLLWKKMALSSFGARRFLSSLFLACPGRCRLSHNEQQRMCYRTLQHWVFRASYFVYEMVSVQRATIELWINGGGC